MCVCVCVCVYIKCLVHNKYSVNVSYCDFVQGLKKIMFMTKLHQKVLGKQTASTLCQVLPYLPRGKELKANSPAVQTGLSEFRNS